MKKVALLVAVLGILCSSSWADDTPLVSVPSTIEMKQGFLVKWDEPEGGVENLTTVTIAKTKPIESLGDKNVWLDGWTLDLGIAYDAASFDTVALLVGRDFGTIGKYLPIDFPLKDKLELSVYPIGIFVEDVFGDSSIHGASGLGIVKFDVQF